MIDEKEGRNTNLFSTKGFFILISVPFFIFFIMGIFYIFHPEAPEKILVCGDGTSYGSCSERMPYFCSDGNLLEDASLCGCPDILMPRYKLCISRYQTSPKDISLNYVLRGEEGKINFRVYGGMADYLSKLPRSIHYDSGEQPSREDFKLRNINNEEQRELILPLVTKIQNLANYKDDQMRIAISIVQNIPFGSSDKLVSIGTSQTNYSRYPYEVLYDGEGVCGEKSELLAILLKEMGYGVSLFYYGAENHEAVGVKCPVKNSVDETGYCFIETSGASIIANNKLEYSGGIMLQSKPEVILISDGKNLSENLYEYKDSKNYISITDKLRKNGRINIFQNLKLDKLDKKYGLADYYNI